MADLHGLKKRHCVRLASAFFLFSIIRNYTESASIDFAGVNTALTTKHTLIKSACCLDSLISKRKETIFVV